MTSERDEEQAMRPPMRFRYLPIVDRPRYTLPGGKRLILWPVVNIETAVDETATDWYEEIPEGQDR